MSSPLTFGTMQFGGKADAAASRAMFDACLAAGITGFDTACGYTDGNSETLLGQFIKEEFTRSPLARLAALAALPVLNRFKARVDHRRYSGGALLGLRGLVFKAHGSSDAFAFERALARAYDAAGNRLLDRVHVRIRSTLAVLPQVQAARADARGADAEPPAAAA